MIEISKKSLKHLLECNASTKLIEVEYEPIEIYNQSGAFERYESDRRLEKVDCPTCTKLRKLLK